MRYREIIKEDAQTQDLMSYWDLVSHFKVEAAAEKLHDAVLPWVNNNSRSRMDKLVDNKKMRLLSKIELFCKMNGPRNYSEQWTTPEQFKAALSQPITMWRGGGGLYNPDFNYRSPWTSFTVSEKRIATFSKYNGTQAIRAPILPTREQYWVTELTIPLDNILLYISNGGDEEVIVSAEDARTAKVIEQTQPDKKPMNGIS